MWVVVAAGVGYLGAKDLQRRSTNQAIDAAKIQTETAGDVAVQTAELLDKQYQQTRTDLGDFSERGTEAVNVLAERVAAGPGEFETSPGYDFRLGEGTKARERSAAARGTVLDPSTQKALTRYGQDYATSDYDNFLRRYYDSLTPLQSLTSTGLSAAGGTAAAGARATEGIVGGYRDTIPFAGSEQFAQAEGTAAQGNLLSDFAGQTAQAIGIRQGIKDRSEF